MCIIIISNVNGVQKSCKLINCYLVNCWKIGGRIEVGTKLLCLDKRLEMTENSSSSEKLSIVITVIVLSLIDASTSSKKHACIFHPGVFDSSGCPNTLCNLRCQGPANFDSIMDETRFSLFKNIRRHHSRRDIVS